MEAQSRPEPQETQGLSDEATDGSSTEADANGLVIDEDQAQDPSGDLPDQPLTPCPTLAGRVRETLVTVAQRIRADGEYHPVVLGPRPGGGAWVAWNEANQEFIRVVRLDARDRLQQELEPFAGEEVHALVGHTNGGAMLVVQNDPDIYSDKYCRGPSTPDKPYCAKLDLLRFEDSGAIRWRTTLTSKTNVDRDGALFIWWYQHTARLVWSNDDQTYGAYSRVAGSSPRPGVPGEVDIHAGDFFKFVDGQGRTREGGWNWGCSHSWSVRLAFNGQWGAACHGDAYPNALRLSVLNPGETLGSANLHEGVDPAQRALGGLVPSNDGFWLSHIAPDGPGSSLQVQLAHLRNDGTLVDERALTQATDLDHEYPFRAYLASYGQGNLLVGWRSNGRLQLAVLDGATGEITDGPVEVGAPIDVFQDFVSYPNGDVGWAWAANDSNELTVVRVQSCR